MSDGIRKNLDVLQAEWSDTAENWSLDWARLKNGNWNPKDRRHFIPHVLAAFVSDFFGLRRTLTYLTIGAILVLLLRWIF